MPIKNQFIEKIISVDMDTETAEKIKYGFNIIYINISKSIVLLILSFILGIFKETIILLASFSCVRACGFGVHSNNTIKCTIIGLFEFLGFSYLAMLLPPFNTAHVIVIYAICTIIFILWAPIETEKRPIGKSRKGFFKIGTLVISAMLFAISFLFGKSLYRNLVVMGVLLEAVLMLPSIRKLII